VLVDFDEERARNRPRKHPRYIVLHLNNVTPHRATRDFECLRITRLLHLSYSPGITLYDFWLFETLKRKLEGSIFGDPVEVLIAMSTILSMIHLHEFISVLGEWKCRLHECIDRGGESF
jgi:hypothetical protein